jgi:glutamyl-tRNA synthetase
MAIANFLFARKNEGKFLIRIEDTDVERSDADLVEPILSALKWLGLERDEEIVFQSQRLEIYADFARKILESGHGYRCFCSPEQLAADRKRAQAEKTSQIYGRRCLGLTDEEIKRKVDAGEKFAIRLKVPDGEVAYNDMVSGDLSRGSADIEDFIIARSNGTATYNLAVVVDDHQMRISHVIRGNDHITNTFKQILIYRALGLQLPRFGHVPLILRPDKKKVSKRLGDKDVAQYRDEGILPEAMFNFLCLLGWSPKTDQEIYTPGELIELFTPDNFNTSNAIFNEEKLVAFNREHIARKPDHELAQLVAPLLVQAEYVTKYWLETRWEYLMQIVAALKPRVRRVSDFVQMSKYFFDFDYTYDTDAAVKRFTPAAADLLEELSDRFRQVDDFSSEQCETALTGMAEEKQIKKAELIHPVRLACTGTPVGPGLYELLAILGKEAVIDRMGRAVEQIRK